VSGLFDNTPPVRVEDFKKLAPLCDAYELQPGKAYVIVCGPKDFSHESASALFAKLREWHPDLNIHIVVTEKPKAIEVREES
jgi:hypothetical protein